MEDYLTVKVPHFTHHAYGSPYFRGELKNVQPRDVIALEGYCEFKELYLKFLNKKINFKTLEDNYVKGIESIDPGVRERVPQLGIPNVFGFILEELKGKKFLELEMMEDYDFDKRDLTQRNIIMFKNLGSIIDKHYKETNSIICLTAFGHSISLKGNIGSGNKLDLTNYTNLAFKEKRRVKGDNASFELVFSLL
ncbi:hypothetical protein GF352_03560 [archaeon]|nr:hypothetical protein [archaeon]